MAALALGIRGASPSWYVWHLHQRKQNHKYHQISSSLRNIFKYIGNCMFKKFTYGSRRACSRIHLGEKKTSPQKSQVLSTQSVLSQYSKFIAPSSDLRMQSTAITASSTSKGRHQWRRWWQKWLWHWRAQGLNLLAD